jgi:hypothetical protein
MSLIFALSDHLQIKRLLVLLLKNLQINDSNYPLVYFYTYSRLIPGR